MNNKIIKSFCYIFVFIFIAIIIFSVFNKKREGLDTSSSDKIINEITAMNPFGWYDSSCFDVTTQKWYSKVGNSSIQTTNLTKLTTPFPYVTGGTNATISNVPWPGENNDYTFIHLAKYNGPSRGRLWTGTTGNWLSGFWNNGVAFYHNGWYQNGINASNGGQDWLLSVDMKNFARINKGLWQANGPAYSPASIGVNSGAFGNEVSDFAIAEFIIFNRSLSQDEYTKIEDYFTKKYGLFGTPMDTSFTTIPSPSPPPQNPKWEVVYSKGSYGNVDKGKQFTDNLFKKYRIFKRECANCDSNLGYKEIYYKRITPYSCIFSIYDNFNNWKSSENILNTDFKLYYTYNDLLNDTNGWTFCNYDDNGVGFPRDCSGSKGGVGNQWNSLTRGGQPNVMFSLITEAAPAPAPTPAPAPAPTPAPAPRTNPVTSIPAPAPAPAPQNQMKTDTTASSNKTDLKPAPIDKKPEVNFAELINLKQPNAVTEININLPARNTMPFADCESMLGCGTYLMPSFPPVPDYGAEPTPYFDPIKF